MAFFASTEELLARFGDIAAAGFVEPIPLNDTKVGFSVKRDYPENIRYKPAIGQKSKKPDNVAAIWVVYTHPEESRKSISESAVPLRIRIANMSRYRMKHWDYDFDDVGGDAPSKESFEASEASPKPIELSYTNEFFFDHKRNVFIDADDRIVDGIDVLNRVFQDHCNTVHLLKGLRLRLKLLAQDRFAGLLNLVTRTLVWSLKYFFGRTLEDSDTMAGLYRGFKFESMKKLETDSLDVLGYKASKHVIVLFCALVIFVSILRYSSAFTSSYASWVARHNFLSLVHGLFAIWILDVVVPRLVFWLINGTIWLRTTIMFMKIKTS